MTRWRLIRVVLLVIALGFLGALLARLGPRHVVAQLSRAGPRAIWLLIAYSAGTAIGAVPWYLLLRRNERPSLGGAIASRFAASGANALVPLLGLGGEPVRLIWLPPSSRAAGAAAVILDRLTYALASGVFLAGGALLTLQLPGLPGRYVTAAIAGASLVIVLVAVAVWLVARQRIAERVHRLLRRLRSRAPSEGVLFGESVDRELGAMLGRRWPVAGALAVGLVARIVLGAEIYIGFRILGVELSLPEAVVFAAVPVLLAFVGAIVPSQLGIQEASQAIVASALGIAPATAVAVVLLQRTRQVVTAAIAWLLIATHRTRRISDGYDASPAARNPDGTDHRPAGPEVPAGLDGR